MIFSPDTLHLDLMHNISQWDFVDIFHKHFSLPSSAWIMLLTLSYVVPNQLSVYPGFFHLISDILFLVLECLFILQFLFPCWNLSIFTFKFLNVFLTNVLKSLSAVSYICFFFGGGNLFPLNDFFFLLPIGNVFLLFLITLFYMLNFMERFMCVVFILVLFCFIWQLIGSLFWAFQIWFRVL